jgi:DNA processing protein
VASEFGGQFATLSAEELIGPLNEVETKFAPKCLYIVGDRNLVNVGPRVAIIGSRKVSEAGLRRTGKLARELVDAGVTIVSGLAEGVDAAAHTSAIDAGGKTIAVIGTPLDVVYPAKNRNLQALIASEYLLISQFGSGTPTQPRNFPQRNRTMALISHASVIVEAGESSGSLSQGWEALRLGRPLFLLQSILENKTLKWPAELIEYGASVLSRTEDVLDMIPRSSQADYAELAF